MNRENMPAPEDILLNKKEKDLTDAFVEQERAQREQRETDIEEMNGVWPEILDALMLDMKRQGKGFLERRRAKQFLYKQRDEVFAKAQTAFERLPMVKQQKKPDSYGMTQREYIAFLEFEKLLQKGGYMQRVQKAHDGIRNEAIKRFLEPRDVIADAPDFLSEAQEDIQALRRLMSPEAIDRMLKKRQNELAQVHAIEQGESVQNRGAEDNGEDEMKKAA